MANYLQIHNEENGTKSRWLVQYIPTTRIGKDQNDISGDRNGCGMGECGFPGFEEGNPVWDLNGDCGSILSVIYAEIIMIYLIIRSRTWLINLRPRKQKEYKWRRSQQSHLWMISVEPRWGVWWCRYFIKLGRLGWWSEVGMVINLDWSEDFSFRFGGGQKKLVTIFQKEATQITNSNDQNQGQLLLR